MILKILRFVARCLPTRLPEIIYTVLLRPAPLRRLANRILRTLAPPAVAVDGLTLHLNRKDPVLSSAVALGIYENFEREIFAGYCKPGAVVVDIGANIGLYTLIAASRVGPAGTVIAIEPHRESFDHLRKTIGSNALSRVRAFNVAIGDRRRRVSLFTTDDNLADSRIYDVTGRRPEVGVEMVDLDSLLAENGVGKVDVIKMDIQGAEGLALRGMARTLADNPKIAILAEFWPWGIKQTGESPAAFLRQLVDAGFRIKTIEEDQREIRDVTDIAALLERHDNLQYTGKDLQRSHANLLCVKGVA